MKRVTVYWRNDPAEYEVLKAVEHVQVGVDREEFIISDTDLDPFRAIVRYYDQGLWVDGVADVTADAAKKDVERDVSAGQRAEALKRLESIAAKDRK